MEWKKLNRSKKWLHATSYQQARLDAIGNGIMVQHGWVR